MFTTAAALECSQSGHGPPPSVHPPPLVAVIIAWPYTQSADSSIRPATAELLTFVTSRKFDEVA